MQQYLVESCGRKKMCKSALPCCFLLFFPFQDNDAGGSRSSASLLVLPSRRGTGLSAGLQASAPPSAKRRYLICGVVLYTQVENYQRLAGYRYPRPSAEPFFRCRSRAIYIHRLPQYIVDFYVELRLERKEQSLLPVPTRGLAL